MGAMNPPLLTITSDARAKIDGVRTFNEFPDAVLRVRVLGKEGRTFRYEIALEDPRERADDDVSVETDGLTVVVTLHQVDYALRYCERVVALKAGKVVYDGPSDGLRREQLIDIYGPEFEDVFWEGAPT